MGLRLFLVSRVSCQSVFQSYSEFFQGWGLNFFLEVHVQFFGGRIHLKISILS